MNAKTPKWQRILAAFLDGRSFNTFEASRELGTSCLHSDVSDLERRGLKFNHTRETVPGFGGQPAHVTRYRLRFESYSLGRQLLGLERAPLAMPAAGLDYESASRGW